MDAVALLKLIIRDAPRETKLASLGAKDSLVARRALAELFPTRAARLAKEAALIDDLKAVKKDSDARNWRAKHARLRELIRKYPDDFAIDSRQGNLVGITHVPTGFRYHTPAHTLPFELRELEATNAPRTAPTNRRRSMEVGAV